MNHPPVLLIESDRARRRELALDLAALAYEVVPALTVEEGLRFASGLATAVVLLPLELALTARIPGAATPEDPWAAPSHNERPILAELSATARNRRRVVILLGRHGAEPEELPPGVFFLPTSGLDTGDLVERIHLVLIGCEMGIESNWRLSSLVGDLSEHSIPELLRSCGRLKLSGTLETDHGSIALAQGQPTAAAAGPARGLKALCRLARLSEGAFRLLPTIHLAAVPPDEREITQELGQILVTLIEDTLTELPNRRGRLGLNPDSDLFAHSVTELERGILRAAQQQGTVGQLHDELEALDGEIARTLQSLQARGFVHIEQPISPVRILTDSTSDLPVAMAREHGMGLIPLNVHIGQQVFQDRVDLSPGEFYRLLRESPDHPSSSPPTAAAFATAFGRILKHQDVVSIHISSVLSETWKNASEGARDAQAESAGEDREGDAPASSIEVLDSRQVSLPLGLLGLFAARMAARGARGPEIAERIRQASPRFHSFFIVDTLEYLARGGRIGKAQALMGKLLRIKPILTLEDGQVASFDRVRGGRATHPRILEHLGERVTGRGPIFAGIAHASAPMWADRLRAMVEERFDVLEMLQVEMGPVVGTHAGPGTVGVCVFQPDPEEQELFAQLGS